MKSFVSISDIGSIRILNIPLGVDRDYVRKTLRQFDLQENNNCLYLDNVSIDNLPPLNIHFNVDKEGNINRIYIGQSQLNQKECDIVFNYFKKQLCDKFNVFSEKEEEIVLSNSLHRVSIGKQKGLSENENKYPFFLHILGRLMGKNEPELKYAMKQLYLERGIVHKNKPHRSIQITQTIKVLLFVFALIVAFLFALNGRYMSVKTGFYFDKWTKTLLEVERINTIE